MTKKNGNPPNVTFSIESIQYYFSPFFSLSDRLLLIVQKTKDNPKIDK